MLLTAGYWHIIYWAESFWNNNYWPHFGRLDITEISIGKKLILDESPFVKKLILLDE